MKKLRMKKVKAEVLSCRRCRLCKDRKNPVVGTGNLDSPLLLVGEAPGRKEDEQGEPFVGSAGKLLDRILERVGFEREEIYITNVVKCRPPGNRRPRSDEMEECSQHLDRMLEIITPRVIAPMGNSSAGFLMKKFDLRRGSIGEMHGKHFPVDASWGKIILFPLHHPAAALYNKKLENVMLKDFASLKRLLDQYDNTKF